MAQLPKDGYLVTVSQGLKTPPRDYEDLVQELQTCSVDDCGLPLIRSGPAILCVHCDRPQAE